MKGWRVLVTSPSGEETARLLEAAGATPVSVPTIETRAVESPVLDAALADPAAYDWIVVTSANGAAAVLDRLDVTGAAGGPRWAAVGPKTAAALEAGGIAVDHVPEAGFGAAIPDGMGDLSGRRVLLARAAGAGEDLPAILRERGADVDDLVAYETVEGPESSRAAIEAALDSGLDAAIFTSGSTARGCVRLAGGPRALAGVAVVAIGPSTAAAVAEAGLRADAVAERPTPEGLVAALAALARRGSGAGRPPTTPETTERSAS